MNKLKVGDKLYDYSLREYTVIKIGRKYARLEGRELFRVDTKTMKVKLWNGYMNMYTSRLAVADGKEHSELLSKIRQFFDMFYGGKPTLDQLRRIDEIISENKQ